MLDENPPSEQDAQRRSENSEEKTAMIVTSPNGAKVGMAPLGTGCRNYSPGHSIHSIHARLGGQSRDWVQARVLIVEGNYIEFVTETGTWRRWNHNASLLRRIAEVPELLPGVKAEWSERYYLLKVEVDGVGYLLSLAESDEKACMTW